MQKPYHPKINKPHDALHSSMTSRAILFFSVVLVVDLPSVLDGVVVVSSPPVVVSVELVVAPAVSTT